jgi:tetratricopeptide (TPR) repeat protein
MTLYLIKMNKLFILLIVITVFTPDIGFSQDVIENKSLVTLEISSSIKDSNSNSIESSFVEIYIGDKIIRTVRQNKKGEIKFDLFLLNEYTLVFSAHDYKSKSLDISTLMSVEDVEKNKAGWVMPMTLTLEKGYNVEYSLLKPIASVGLVASGYFDFLSKATYHFKIGNKHIAKGNFQKAIESYSQGVEKDSLHTDSYFNRGICYFKLGDKESACKDWNKAKKLGDKAVANLLEKHCQ